jgi:hypothetical protein
MSNRSEGAMSNYAVPMTANPWHREVMVAGLVIWAAFPGSPAVSWLRGHPHFRFARGKNA